MIDHVLSSFMVTDISQGVSKGVTCQICMNKYQSNISYSKLLENIKCLLLKISFLDFSTKLQIRVELTDIIVIPSTDDKNGHGSQNVRSLTVHPPLTWLLA